MTNDDASTRRPETASTPAVPQHVDELDVPVGEIAQQAVEPRDAARLLVVDRRADALHDRIVRDLPDILQPGDLLVANRSYVLPARFWLRRDTGKRVEGLFINQDRLPPNRWRVILNRATRVKVGETLRFTLDPADVPEDASTAIERPTATLLKREANGHAILELADVADDASPRAVLEAVGKPPLPPYIDRPADAKDSSRYQTTFADPAAAGSVAAPTAGLHFTPELLDRLRAGGVNFAAVTLHVGIGTFRPIAAGSTLDEHDMHAEWYDLPPETADAIARTKQQGGRVIAIGTTSCRTLEATGGVTGSGWTDIFIRPPYQPRVIDGLLTNFHLPKSTLIALVMAIAGVERTRRAYQHAVEAGYRFYSYGDAMLIV